MKRFTDTAKWSDPWFQDLPIKYKAFWAYINDNCDASGVWKCNIRLATFQIGEPFESSEILRLFPNIEGIGNGKWWIRDFCEFQYGQLSPDCRPHQNVSKLLETHGLTQRVSKGYRKGIQRDKEKEEDKEEEQDKEKEGNVTSNGIVTLLDLPAEQALIARVCALFNKRVSTGMDASEAKAWRTAKALVAQTTEKEWELLEWAYGERDGTAFKYRRKGMATLLNNWNGEFSRARDWKRSSEKL